MSGALSKAEDGAIRHDGSGCVRCWMCIMACPYGAILIDPKGKSILKCDLCPGRETPACVGACKTGALLLVIDEAGIDNSMSSVTAEGA